MLVLDVPDELSRQAQKMVKDHQGKIRSSEL